MGNLGTFANKCGKKTQASLLPVPRPPAAVGLVGFFQMPRPEGISAASSGLAASLASQLPSEPALCVEGGPSPV